MPKSQHTSMIIVGAWCLIIFSVAFVGLTIFIDKLAFSQKMSYGVIIHNWFQVTAGTGLIRFLLTVYALLPLLLIPGAVAAFYTFIDKHEANMRTGMYFATAGALALSISLLMLPSLNWHFITYLHQKIPAAQQEPMIVILQSLHSYLGVFIGDLLGLGCLVVWFLITSFVMLRSNVMPHAVGVIELIIAIVGVLSLAARYSGITPLELINLQAPGVFALWIFICGVSLLSFREN